MFGSSASFDGLAEYAGFLGRLLDQSHKARAAPDAQQKFDTVAELILRQTDALGDAARIPVF